MSKFYLIVLFILIPKLLTAQRISGIVYDDKETLPSIQIINRTQNIVVFSDKDGNFLIPAKLNDSISFTSRLHNPFKMKVEVIHFSEIFVVELKKLVNELDEVYLENTPKAKTFEQAAFNNKFNEQFQNDRKNNPEKYSGAASGNMDFVAIASMIAGLFKSKKPKPEVLIPINAKHLDSLFAKDRFFNEKLILNDLEIEKSLHGLFFEFCETKQIDSKWLHADYQLMLLEALMEASTEFKTLVASARKED